MIEAVLKGWDARESCRCGHQPAGQKAQKCRNTRSQSQRLDTHMKAILNSLTLTANISLIKLA